MKYYFPIHLNGDNRGCEGIAKGTAQILGVEKQNMIGLCTNVELDKRLGINQMVSLKSQNPLTLAQRVFNKIKRLFHLNSCVFTPYTTFLCSMEKDDVMISTGGDMMCYGNNQVITTNNLASSRGNKTILWGCSMGEKNLTPEKKDTLFRFSLIYARESLSYDFFRNLGLKNVICLPDPAFVLAPEQVNLPSCFNEGKKVVGINLSNYTVGGFHLNTPFGKEVYKLFDYLLNNTELHILLVPHVFWKGQDDRILADEIMRIFSKYSNRITILDAYQMNYLQIRYVISKCESFIGGRTHAVISAYATCTPAIALGYSIKSRGIAHDLQLARELVVDTTNPSEGELLNSFLYMQSHLHEIKQHLEEIMPEYRRKPYEIQNLMSKL
jgi:polysaccharide pyruvyl transferase WcaK-like protein